MIEFLTLDGDRVLVNKSRIDLILPIKDRPEPGCQIALGDLTVFVQGTLDSVVLKLAQVR